MNLTGLLAWSKKPGAVFGLKNSTEHQFIGDTPFVRLGARLVWRCQSAKLYATDLLTLKPVV